MKNIKEVAEDIFNTAQYIDAIYSGGISPDANILSVNEKDGAVIIRYQYAPVCGLSDCHYHTVQDIKEIRYEFDENGIFKGDIEATLDPNRSEHSLIWADEEVSEFYERHPEQRPKNNTKIVIQYRDADNYKSWTEVVVRGKVTDEQKEIIRNSLETDGTFIPEQIGIEAKRWKKEPTSADHCYCELDVDRDITLTDKHATEERTIAELTDAFASVGKAGWDCITYAVDACDEEAV